MAKFKVGDKVRVKSTGNIGTISRADEWRMYPYKLKDDPHDEPFDGDEIEHVEPRREFIVIRRDGAKTIAELRHDREVIKSAVATCSENDTFDFQTGATLAFDRLMGRQNIDEAVKAWNEPAPAPEPPKYYTGKVFAEKIVENDAREGMRNRIGRVFEIKNGIIQGDVKQYDLDDYDPIISFSDFCLAAKSTKWHEVKSDV